MNTSKNTPTIVCLCGSTRFFKSFMQANYAETMAGRIVLSVGFYMHARDEAHGEGVGITPVDKSALDVLHLRKIDLANEVLVVNEGDYVGASTKREVWYAMRRGKPIRWMFPTKHTPEEIASWFTTHEDWERAAIAASNIKGA